MGGRTACRSPTTRSSTASWPWRRGSRPASRSRRSAGTQLHAAHGRRDRITRARDTRAYVERAASVASVASFTDMGPRGHYLLRGVAAWNAFALDAVRRVLA